MPASKAKIAVLIEEHFDGTEYRRFNEFFPQQGYQVEYVSHLWGQPSLTFGNNPDEGVVDLHATVTTEIKAKLTADKLSNVKRIEVKTENGVVTLNGSADKAGNVDKAVTIAKGTDGVKSVDNKLTVKP